MFLSLKKSFTVSTVSVLVMETINHPVRYSTLTSNYLLPWPSLKNDSRSWWKTLQTSHIVERTCSSYSASENPDAGKDGMIWGMRYHSAIQAIRKTLRELTSYREVPVTDVIKHPVQQFFPFPSRDFRQRTTSFWRNGRPSHSASLNCLRRMLSSLFFVLYSSDDASRWQSISCRCGSKSSIMHCRTSFLTIRITTSPSLYQIARWSVRATIEKKYAAPLKEPFQ